MARPKIKRRSQVSDGSRWEPATLKEAATYYACYIVAMAAHLAAAGQGLQKFRGVSRPIKDILWKAIHRPLQISTCCFGQDSARGHFLPPHLLPTFGG